MRQTARAAAQAATIAASLWAMIAQASLAPIDKLVDLLEAASIDSPAADEGPSTRA